VIKEGKEIQERDLEIIEGEFINISQSTVRNVEGGHVELQQVGALSIDGERIESTQCATVFLRGRDVALHQTLSGITMGDNTTLNFSCSPVSLSRGEMHVSRSAAGVIGAGTVRAEKTAALLVLTKEVDGQMTTLLDWKSAAALGAVVGGLWGLLSLFRKK
jgi:hypothetical protein